MAKAVEPHDIEAESAVLGAVMLRNELWHDAASVLKSEDFYRGAHQKVWASMKRLIEKGSAIDALTLKDDLHREDDLETVGGYAYLSSLVDGVPKSINLVHYARIVREKATLRTVLDIGQRVVNQAYGQADSAMLIEAAVSELLRNVMPDELGAVDLGPGVAEYVRQLDDATTDEVIPTGFRDIDDMMAGGLRAGDLVIVAARPSVGKSS
jgi:replicative DNA helicase